MAGHARRRGPEPPSAAGRKVARRTPCPDEISAGPLRIVLYRLKLFSEAYRACEQITFNAEAAEAAEEKCLGISQRALRALRSNVVFFHRLYRVCASSCLRAAGRDHL